MSLVVDRVEDFGKQVDRLQELIAEIREEREEDRKRVRRLEEDRLKLKARENTLLAARKDRDERRVRLSLRVGIGAAVLAFVSTAVSGVHGLINWP